MNFKDEYKRDFGQIKTDEAFRNQLEDEINKASSQKRNASRNIKMYTAVVSAAAVVALVVGVGYFRTADTDEGDISLKAETVTSAALTGGLFNVEEWYGEVQTDDEIYTVFADLMSSGKLETLYCSVDDTFDEADILTAEDSFVLAEKLAAAVPAEEAFGGNVTNCMAVFEDGKIVKFSISDTGLVKLKDAEAVYKFE